jgi:hypothetical protein
VLRWRVEIDVTQWDRKAEENLKGLNRAIQIHVKDGVLIMPQPGIWPCYLVTDEEDPIIALVRLDLL